MMLSNCFAGLTWRKNNKIILQSRHEELVKPLEIDEPHITGYHKSLDNKDSLIKHDPYDGDDDGHDSTNREFPKFQTQERAVESQKSKEITDASKNGDDDIDDEECGHVRDPGLRRATAWVASPKLKRSCSTLSKFLDRFHGFDPRYLHDLRETVPRSNELVRSHKSLDRVMLWSHRNHFKPFVSLNSQPLGVSTKNHQSEYKSEFADHNQVFTGESTKKFAGFTNQSSLDLWPSHHRPVAFSAGSSSMKRVDEWVRRLDVETAVPLNEDEENGNFPSFPASPKTERSLSRNVSEEILQANNLIQLQRKSSSEAHISSIGLKVIPSISHFTSLKSIDLSNNFLAQITPASLPKGLHALNLSKNMINGIEGLRDLTRLRVLDLSYNRICRIGRGLSNCTMIKELCLSGNKISNVEGLHRLLKLSVLDLSFNKIATTKAIGQLVANYNSLRNLEILGNPIQSNVGEEQLGKNISSLLPKLVYLNKQLTKPHRAREFSKDNIARATLGGAHPRSHIGDDTHKGRRHGSKGRSQSQLRKTSAAETLSH